MYDKISTVHLSSGYPMPLVGVGTFRIKGKELIHKVIDESLKVGFRSIDTAAVYKNEEDIGSALSSLLPKYNLQRSDIFITSKLSPSDNGHAERIEQAVKKSLSALGTTYIDLYLIHWPGAMGIPVASSENPVLRARTWSKLVELQKQGFIRSIGVSNYTINHLTQLLSDCRGVPPAVNQVECHPHYLQEDLRKFCNNNGIHVQAYSSLGTSRSTTLLNDPIVTSIASELNVSPARLLLRWALQQEMGVIPKATKPEHIRDNIKLGFTIDEQSMKMLSSLPQQKYAWNPFNEEMDNFANEITKLCLDKYKSLGKTGKPSLNEWTILSGIAVKQNSGNLRLAALATGTKCLGGSELHKLKWNEIGSKLSDSHAEVLARRAFLRYLYEQLDLLISNCHSDIFCFDEAKTIKLKNGTSFHFYTSQTPCGDCSIFPKKDTDNDSEPAAKIRRIHSYPETITDNSGVNNKEREVFDDIYRTGAKCLVTEKTHDPHLPGPYYHIVGPLRTKPGRGDPTLSLSCSDKIAKWNVLGLQGALLSILIPTIKMATLTVGGGYPLSLEAMERGLYKRFNLSSSELQIMQADVSFEHKKGMKRAHPCPSSIIWSNVGKRNIEVAVEGRKQGATKKKGGNYLLVTRRGLFETFLKLCDKYAKSEFYTRHPKKIFYTDCKQWSRNYQENWMRLKSEAFNAWPSKPPELQKFIL